ncbi:hypothetical protein Plim_1591 [Planctopirus limnophila DSM 3776]|uniref:Uncharacterized protein n=1 Tax=Planctopirus limnophila (strain ATCC 43296 / DSM 3776 / IFAM 1008 / Mu 290) TaxID=521674 RepID=D5SWS4_PLAL2|nr:hypothetical protein Plim_1591 [Planctopirus limnophila DSM 3776]
MALKPEGVVQPPPAFRLQISRRSKDIIRIATGITHSTRKARQRCPSTLTRDVAPETMAGWPRRGFERLGDICHKKFTSTHSMIGLSI